MINVDIGYHNPTSIEYLHKKGITPIILDRKQTRKE